ncbi:VOC family protein, partial [Kineococcus glutinatus]|uniref:VOC family protein n=1 Tax=Kineococcus glutinatus TaxID=1070872 RepID=UPI0031EFF82A
ADVVGWEVTDPDPAYGDYLTVHRGGNAAAGVGPAQAEQVWWTVYIATDDLDAAAAAVTAHGGTLVVEPGDVGPLGRMAIAADPTGATFGLWQAGTHIGAALVNEPGGLAWEDLRSTDPDASRAFFAAVFGWTYEAMPDFPEYTTFTQPGEAEGVYLGGIGPVDPDTPGERPGWLPYFGVADTDTAVATAERLGGTVVAPAETTPYGRMAVLTDPHGAEFAVIASDWTQQPDRS